MFFLLTASFLLTFVFFHTQLKFSHLKIILQTFRYGHLDKYGIQRNCINLPLYLKIDIKSLSMSFYVILKAEG